MIARKIAIIIFALIAMFLTSCGNSNSYNQHEEHNYATETAKSKTETQNAGHNEKGKPINVAGYLITGYPGHKEMIGSQGDMCPLCEYMVMVPIT